MSNFPTSDKLDTQPNLNHLFRNPILDS